MSNYELSGVALHETPLLNGAGLINGTSEERILREVEELSQTPIGAITVGSFTVNPREGNEAEFGSPVEYYDKRSDTMYNSLGLPNIGIHAARLLMPKIVDIAHSAGKPVIASVSPVAAKDAGGASTVEQVKQLTYQMAASGADLIEINTSCPNIVTEDGGRKPIVGHDLKAMEEIIDVIDHINDGLRIKNRVGLKLPPYIMTEEFAAVPKLSELFKQSLAVGYIATSNTVGGRKPVLPFSGKNALTVPGGVGGRSGPSQNGVGMSQLAIWNKELEGSDVDIVSLLGVNSGKQIAQRLECGASAVGVVTALWPSINRKETVHKLVSEWADTL